jgi:hypothetical protein
MAIMAPKGRKPLSADALFRLVRSGFANIPEHGSDEGDISFTDALMSGCAMFSLQSPALLAFDKQRVESNWDTISGIPHAPCDTRMRERLAPVSPESLRAAFKRVCALSDNLGSYPLLVKSFHRLPTPLVRTYIVRQDV